MNEECHGNGANHCCWFKGVECPFVEENTVPGRRWACGLLRDLGNWNKVIRSNRYKKEVQPLYDSVPELSGMNCRDWPQEYPEVMATCEIGGAACCYSRFNPEI